MSTSNLAAYQAEQATATELQGRLNMQLATGPLVWSSAMAMLYELRSETQS
jgi:hypothetical protein